jgi:signal transduction histidine kinase
MPRLRSILPNRIGGQMALLILVSLVAIHAVITALLWNFGHFDAPRLPPPVQPPPFFAGPFVVTALFLIVSVMLLALWAGRFLIRPLTGFTQAAESFQPDSDISPIPERGPEEVRAAARALNAMQCRIKGLVADRTRMLAAMGHDLRTPITRMRLRSEFITDETLRGQMLRDLDQMKAMIDAALTYLRDGKSRDDRTRADVATLLQTICDQHADMGHDVSYFGPDHFIMDAQPDALHRAIANLVDNAVRYAGKARIRLSMVPAAVRIEVQDDGPGIPDSEKAAMLEPFVRGDAARGMNDAQGFGLGLAIARTVAEAHGGRLSLHDREPHGLIARVEIARDQIGAN